jgi:hypothetical protein
MFEVGTRGSDLGRGTEANSAAAVSGNTRPGEKQGSWIVVPRLKYQTI